MTRVHKIQYLFGVASQDQIGVKGDATKDFDLLFWFLNKKFNKVDSKLLDFIRSNYLEKLPDAVTECAKLSFYKTFQLLRITDSSMTESRRSYALFRPAKDGFQVVPLNGTSVPIHETNRIPGELNLAEETADEYLRFFCSAVHAQEGPFLIVDRNNYAAVFGENPIVLGSLKEELELGIRSEIDPGLEEEFAKLSNPFPRSSIKRRKTCVIYSSALFRAWFAIDDAPQNPGMVQMVEDEPILTGLKVNIPRYSDGSLFVLSVLIEKEPPRIPPVPSDEKAKASDKESKPTHYFSRKQSDTERDEVDKLLKNFTRNHTGPGTIESEVVFASNRT